MEELVAEIARQLPEGFLVPADGTGFLMDLTIVWVGFTAVLLLLNFIFGQLRQLITGQPEGPAVSAGALQSVRMASQFSASQSATERNGQPDALEAYMRGSSDSRSDAAYGGHATEKRALLRHEQTYRANGLVSKTTGMTLDARKKRKKSK